MKKLSLLFFISLFYNINFGQTDFKKRKSIFLELAGSGGFGSINYETNFYKKNNLELTWRAGLSIFPIDNNNGFAFTFPLMINTLIGKESHKLELGIGQGVTVTTKGSAFALGLATVGYRYQPLDKNLFYRITYTPLISYLIDFQVQQWGGISIGYTFKK